MSAIAEPTRVEWTYLDVMASIIAEAPKLKFKASTSDWNRLWFDLAQSEDGRELLGDLHFEDREPYPPFSDEVEACIRLLSRAGVLSLGNPRYQYFTIEQENKDAIKRGQERLLAAHGDAIKRLAHTFSARLASD